MNIKQAFKNLLHTRGKLTGLGMAAGTVSKYKTRIKAKDYPKEPTMRKWLLLAGYTYQPEKWKRPKSEQNKKSETESEIIPNNTEAP